MCKYCDHEYPSEEKLAELFYWQFDKLHRQWLRRENFQSERAFTIYNKLANKPCNPVSKNNPNLFRIHGMSMPMHIGLIKSIMNGKRAAGWYHRNEECAMYFENGTDKPIPPRYPKYAKIPKKIYKNGFLELRRF